MTSEPTVPSGSQRSDSSPVSEAESAETLACRASLQPGRVVLDKYRIERALGAGGMGLVCLATHQVLNELVILKFVRPDLAGNDEAVERLLVEARLASKLRGNHFARIHDAGRLEDGVPYIAMEYLVGHTLAEELVARGALPEAEAVDWTIQACTALEECHEVGIVHRDVKPENLFLAETARGDRVLKLIDFGISKHIQLNHRQRGLTNPGESLGSPWYMAPEQMRAPQSVDRRADIWSLGVVLFQLVAGRVPFDGNTLAEVCAQVLCEEPLPLSVAASAVGPELSAVVARCLEKDPAQRYATASAMADALRMRTIEVVPAAASVAVDIDVAVPLHLPDPQPEATPVPATVLSLDPQIEVSAPDELQESDFVVGIPGERRWGPAFLGLTMIAAALASVVLLVPEVRAKATLLSSQYSAGWLTPARLDISIPDTDTRPPLRQMRPALALLSVPPNPVQVTTSASGTGQPAALAEEVLSTAEIAARTAAYKQYLRDNGLTPVKEALEEVESSEGSAENPY